MISGISDFDNIPGMPVFDPSLRVVAAQNDHAPYSKRIQQNLHCLCNALTDAHTLSQWTDNLMGIGLFQLVIAYIFTDKIVNVFLLLPFGKLHGRTNQFFHSRIHRFLVFNDLLFLKQILRNENKIW